jgi:signal transduction histidine kinase
MYPNKKTEQTCKLVALGGVLLLILAGAAMIGAFGGKGDAYPKFRALGYAALAAAGITYIVIGRYGIREQLRKYLMIACGCTAGFFLTQIISGIVLFMKSSNTMDALSIGVNIFFAILGAFYCVYFIFDLRKNYFNMRYDQMVFAVLAGLGVVAAALLFLYNAKDPYQLKILEKGTGAGARLITFILPAAMLWFCDRLTEPFTDNEVAQVRVAERQAVRIAEAQRMTEQYNKVEAKKAAERRRREEERRIAEEEERAAAARAAKKRREAR